MFSKKLKSGGSRPTLRGAAIVLIGSAACLAGEQTEGFSSDTFQDPTATTASWDTANGVIGLERVDAEVIGSDTLSAGEIHDMALVGNFAYLAAWGGGLVVVDYSDPAAPSVVASLGLGSLATGVTVAGDYAYVVAVGNGLHVVDISDPTLPATVGSYYTGSDTRGVAVAGNYAYVAAGNNGLIVVDITDPTLPGYLDGDVGQGAGSGVYTLATSDRAFGVAVSGNYAFVGNWWDGLLVVDITDPTLPGYLDGDAGQGAGSGVYVLDTPRLAGDPAIAGDYLYLNDYDSLQVIDIADPTQPTFAGSVSSSDHMTRIQVDGDRAYVTEWLDGLKVLDISDPTQPTVLDTVAAGPGCGGVAVAGRFGLFGDVADVVSVKIAEPETATLVGTWESVTSGWGPEGVEIAGNHAYIPADAEGLLVIDITRPFAPVLAGSVATTGTAYAVTIDGNVAYVAHSYGLDTIDISDPANPQALGSFSAGGEFYGVAIDGDRAYATSYTTAGGGQGVLLSLDISDPAQPIQGGAPVLMFPWPIIGIDIAGDYLFIANRDGGLRVVDVSNPLSPANVTNLAGLGDVIDVAVEGNYAFLADRTSGSGGLRIVDIADPANPALVGSLTTQYASRVAVAGDTVAIGDGPYGYVLIDASDPTSPQQIDAFTYGGSARGVALAGQYLFGAESHAGGSTVSKLQVVRWATGAGSYRPSGIAASVNIAGGGGDFASATLTIEAAIPEFCDPECTPIGGIMYELSNDGGSTWEEVTPGEMHTFGPTGSQLRWRAVLYSPDPSGTPLLDELTISYEVDGIEPLVPSFMREDDGGPENSATIDYNDDYMDKSLEMMADPETIGLARLWMYGQPYNYPGEDFQEREDFRIRVNGSASQLISFDVGLVFDYDTENYRWTSFDVPPEWLIAGLNEFYIYKQPPSGGWDHNNLRVGIDTSNDFDHSWWYGNGFFDGYENPAACDGELMLYLELYETAGLPGDMNCDGNVDFFDIDPFVLAVTDPAAYLATHADCDIMNADLNDDGEVNFFDIDPFVLLIVGGD